MNSEIQEAIQILKDNNLIPYDVYELSDLSKLGINVVFSDKEEYNKFISRLRVIDYIFYDFDDKIFNKVFDEIFDEIYSGEFTFYITKTERNFDIFKHMVKMFKNKIKKGIFKS